MRLVHFLPPDDDFVRCGAVVDDLVQHTHSDMLMVTCRRCKWLIVNDAKPKALRRSETEAPAIEIEEVVDDGC